MNLQQTASEIFSEALKTVLSETLIRETMKFVGDDLFVANRRYPQVCTRNLFVFGNGKASVGAATAVTEILGNRITGWLVVSNQEAKLDRICVVVGAHPRTRCPKRACR